jgi:transcriptional regulator with XRE-family HTH domain
MKSDRSIRMVLATNVRRLRELRNWSLPILARRLGVSVLRITAIEAGHIPGLRIAEVQAIARVLGVEVVDLLTLPARKRKPRSGQRVRKKRN